MSQEQEHYEEIKSFLKYDSSRVDYDSYEQSDYELDE
jgi:hypothetical protein